MNEPAKIQQYVPFLLEYQRRLCHHLKVHDGGMDYLIVPFTIHEVYQELKMNTAIKTPQIGDSIEQQESSYTNNSHCVLIASEKI